MFFGENTQSNDHRNVLKCKFYHKNIICGAKKWLNKYDVMREKPSFCHEIPERGVRYQCKSSDLHLLDFWFWYALKEKDYEGQQAPFSSIDEKTSLKVCVRRASFAEIRVTIQKTIECFNLERRKTDRA